MFVSMFVVHLNECVASIQIPLVYLCKQNIKTARHASWLRKPFYWDLTIFAPLACMCCCILETESYNNCSKTSFSHASSWKHSLLIIIEMFFCLGWGGSPEGMWGHVFYRNKIKLSSLKHPPYGQIPPQALT